MRRLYSFSDIEITFPKVLSDVACPGCKSESLFSRHGSYAKYHYSALIRILRVRCKSCRRTHALIPAFSLPGTSIGTKEGEEYLIARSQGTGRKTASKALSFMGVAAGYPKQLDRMFIRAVAQGKALFAESCVDPRLSSMQWVQELVGRRARPIYSLNRYCLAHGYNCLCFCRASIIRFSGRSAGKESSHNRGSPGQVPAQVCS
jgi:hypothetical protein